MSTVTGVTPRRVFSPTEHLHRDRAVADDAVAGRFTNGGVRLDVGLPPDWRTAGLADDEEWHIEWSKFTFGLDLAHAWTQTGDEAYLRTWQLLVRSWIDQQAPDADTPDVTARRLQHWVFAWQVFAAAPGFPGLDPDLEPLLLGSVAAQLDHVRATLSPERNHRTLELFALLVVPLALPGLDPGGDRARQAWALMQDNLLTDVRVDGVHRERSTHYHLIALRSFVAARVSVARAGWPVPAEYDERLLAACRFGLHVHRPDGQIPAVSDSDSGSYLDLLALAGEVLDDDELRWGASRGTFGRAPASRGPGLAGSSFPVGGYHVQRSGWGTEEPWEAERFLLLGAGPLGDGGHGHYDALGVEAYADGRPLVVDPGRFTYAEGDPNWRHWFKGTAAHNTVTVDGLDQQPYRRGKPKGPRLACRLLGRWAGGGLDVLHGEVTSPAYDAVHRRVVAFVDGRYWLVADELDAPTPHEYAVRWHLADAAEPQVERYLGAHRAVTPAVRIDTVGADAVDVEPGWVSPLYGVRTAAPVLVARRLADRADVVTLLASVRPAGTPTLLETDPARGLAVVATPGTGTDTVAWRPTPVEAGGLAVTAEHVLLSTGVDGRLRAAHLRGATSVVWGGDGAPPALRPDAEHPGSGWLHWVAP